jgi:hypothetical protein
MRRYSDGELKAPPRLDADRRGKLSNRLDRARQSAVAAQTEIARLKAEIDAAAHRAAGHAAEAAIAAKLVFIDEAHATLPALAAAIAATFAHKRHVDAARNAIVHDMRPDVTPREIFLAMEVFDRARTAAESVPFAPPENEYEYGWRHFAARLAGNATATVDGTPEHAEPATLDMDAIAANAVQAAKDAGAAMDAAVRAVMGAV